MPRQRTEPGPNVVFFHPDLGIGGAERLIIDAAVGLQSVGHKVTIFTSHCDPDHCFEEAKDGTLDVRVRGKSIFPPQIAGRLHILLATLRQLHLFLAISIFSNELKKLSPNVFVADQLSACLPLLRWLYPETRILFYCHFPDQLLSRRDEGGLLGIVKAGYRWLFDWFEGWSMSGADKVVVNSEFTKGTVERVFGKDSLGNISVVYPSVPTTVYAKEGDEEDEEALWGGMKVLLSINRFERKKDVGLAIRAYAGLRESDRKGARLVVAGGYDNRVRENVQYHQELVEVAESLGPRTATCKTVASALSIPASIDLLFLLSVPGPFKGTLLRNAKLLVYTPTNEHFGIVPVEAMYAGIPVLAANTGGPLETVVDGETGWLKDVKDVGAWTAVMTRVLRGVDEEDYRAMGMKGKKRATELFSRDAMTDTLEQEIQTMIEAKRSFFADIQDLLLVVGVGAFFVLATSLLILAWIRSQTI